LKYNKADLGEPHFYAAPANKCAIPPFSAAIDATSGEVAPPEIYGTYLNR
jgi:hypothetical protein